MRTPNVRYEMSYVGSFYFVKKMDRQTHVCNKEQIMLENRKVLMIATQEIVNDLSDGGKRVSNRNWRLLRDIFGTQNITLVMYTNNSVEDSVGIIRLPAYKDMLDRIANILSGRLFADRQSEDRIVDMVEKNRYDIAFLDRTLYGTLIDRIKKADDKCRIWAFSHNLERNYFKNKLRKYPVLSKIICSRVRRSEEKTLQVSDCLFVLTRRDAELNKKIYGIEACACIPTSFEDQYCETVEVSDDATKQLLFIGTMFGPNYEGIKWFIDNVMEKLPDFTLTIVGKNFETKRKKLQRSNVIVVGTVDNLEDYYYTNNIMVMPIFYGDGQKVKTAEAMMYGKTIIATDEALEGYDVEHVEGIFRCNTADEYIQTILRVSSVHRKRYRDSVRNQFMDKYSYTAVLEKARKAFGELSNDFSNCTSL